MASKFLTLALLASPILAKTDIGGCTYYDTVIKPSNDVGYASRVWYVPDTGEVCEILDCGGGRAPPKTTVPGCAAYEGTETYSPKYIDLKTLDGAVSTAEPEVTSTEAEEARETITEAPLETSTGVTSTKTSLATEVKSSDSVDNGSASTEAPRVTTSATTAGSEATAISESETKSETESETTSTEETGSAQTPATLASTAGAAVHTAGALMVMAGAAVYAGIM